MAEGGKSERGISREAETERKVKQDESVEVDAVDAAEKGGNRDEGAWVVDGR